MRNVAGVLPREMEKIEPLINILRLNYNYNTNPSLTPNARIWPWRFHLGRKIRLFATMPYHSNRWSVRYHAEHWLEHLGPGNCSRLVLPRPILDLVYRDSESHLLRVLAGTMPRCFETLSLECVTTPCSSCSISVDDTDCKDKSPRNISTGLVVSTEAHLPRRPDTLRRSGRDIFTRHNQPFSRLAKGPTSAGLMAQSLMTQSTAPKEEGERAKDGTRKAFQKAT